MNEFKEIPAINRLIINYGKIGYDKNLISDGHHTFGELYEHRVALYMALCKAIKHSDIFAATDVWRSVANSDGEVTDGWFLLGIGSAHGHQITYHLPDSKWEECEFAETIDKAPRWDGHTSADVLERLKKL